MSDAEIFRRILFALVLLAGAGWLLSYLGEKFIDWLFTDSVTEDEHANQSIG